MIGSILKGKVPHFSESYPRILTPLSCLCGNLVQHNDLKQGVTKSTYVKSTNSKAHELTSCILFALISTKQNEVNLDFYMKFIPDCNFLDSVLVCVKLIVHENCINLLI